MNNTEKKFPLFEVKDTWERRHNEKYGTVRIIPVDIHVKLIHECPEVAPKWYIFAIDYQTRSFLNDMIVIIYQKAVLHPQGYDYMNCINCIATEPNFNIDDKWKIIGWLFSLFLDEIPC